ncbi:MAG: sialidase family protein [Verrucomicrobiota bacterium]
MLASASTALAAFNRDPLVVPESKKSTISRPSYPGLVNPNPRGWYYKCANIVQARDGSLVVCWQLSDNHTSLTTFIMTARSVDGGKTWGGYQVISSANVWEDGAVWIVPQMSVLRDGRIAIVCDLGHRTPHDDWPMLVDWQLKPTRGMWNYIFWSSDDGKSWTSGEMIDKVGGEPGYILETSDGTLAYTRTSSRKTDKLKNPPQPWGNNYYRNEIVFSRDGGKTWGDQRWLADSPFHGDCEVGLAELSPGKLMGVTRIGLGNGRFGHPSRLVFSDDNGKTWPRAVPAPFYGQRAHVRRLQSGKFLVTYRNVWGSPGSRALVFDPNEPLGFQPNSWIMDESRCELTSEEMVLRTGDGKTNAVEFSFYPAQDDESRVEIETTLRVDHADANGCAINAGCGVSITPDRIFLSAKPSVGFANDARQWRSYRIVREKGRIAIHVDGRKLLDEPMDALWMRDVRVGNRSQGMGRYTDNEAFTRWRSLSVKVQNRDDYSIDWSWTPAKGYPDQFRRDRSVVLDYAHSSDCGYSSWTQLPDGRIVIVDYTSLDLESYGGSRTPKGKPPIIRAYMVEEKDLVRK